MLMLPQEETQSGTTAIFLASCSPPRFVNRQIVSTGRRIYGGLGKVGPLLGLLAGGAIVILICFTDS